MKRILLVVALFTLLLAMSTPPTITAQTYFWFVYRNTGSGTPFVGPIRDSGSCRSVERFLNDWFNPNSYYTCRYTSDYMRENPSWYYVWISPDGTQPFAGPFYEYQCPRAAAWLNENFIEYYVCR